MPLLGAVAFLRGPVKISESICPYTYNSRIAHLICLKFEVGQSYEGFTTRFNLHRDRALLL
jgi:hypothetical protein